jgi:hypothetical protein
MTDVEDRIAALEARNENLEAEVLKLRRANEPLQPKPPQNLPGQGPRLPGPGGMTGQLYCGAPSEGTTSTGGGSHSFNPWRTGPGGKKEYAPDGVLRDPKTGEAISGYHRGSAPDAVLPVRTHAHQAHVELLDRLFDPGTTSTRR